MKRLLIIVGVFVTSGMIAEASHRSCRLATSPRGCQTSSGSCPESACESTRWYKAKDGTFREMMSYKDALSRAEDADDMELQLKGVQEELVAAQLSIETVQSDAATLKSSLESQIATLQQQLEAERQAVSTQKERGDKAEAAYKQCIEQIAGLREAGKKNEEALTAAHAELRTTTEERDSLKATRAELEQKLSEMTAAKTSAEESAKVRQQELEKLKHDAAESKRPEIETDDKGNDNSGA